VKDLKTPEEVVAYITETIDRVLKEHYVFEHLSPREVFRMRLMFQGLELTDANEIKRFSTGEIVGMFEKAWWSEYPRKMDAVIKLNTPIEFMTIDIQVKND
jgi:hypothetical protein